MIPQEVFFRNLADSGLSGLRKLPAPIPGADGPAAARQLVEAKILTEYQAAAVLNRRFADLRIGHYEVLNLIGRGGMGTVFKARHPRMKRIVAVKVLARHLAENPVLIKRFEREVEAMARLTHPNLVRAFDADDDEHGPFLVMEFVNGRDLAREVLATGPLSPRDAVDSVIQAARGLGFVHRAGIVHRDVKPANLIRDADGVVKVMDLGIARLAQPGGDRSVLTATGTMMGTAEYMAPEQAADAAGIDHRADIYGLGCTLYYLLTGGPPYQNQSVMELIALHRTGPVPGLRAVHPDIPRALDDVFRAMLAKRPDDRPTRMDDVEAELARVLPRLPAAADTRVIEEDSQTTTLMLGPAPVPEPDDFEVEGDLPAVRCPWVILVEPSRTQAGIIHRQLEALGVGTVHRVGSGREALELARSHGRGVIVSAMELPDQTGAELAERVLADPACAGVGFVLSATAGDSRVADRLPAEPRLRLLGKPFNLAQLGWALAGASA